MCKPTITEVEVSQVLRASFCVVCAGCRRDGPGAATPSEAVRLARARGWECADDASANCCPDCQVEQRR